LAASVQSNTSNMPYAGPGFQCARELCSRLWCWCGGVLKALLSTISLNSAFLLPLLQVVSISDQPWRAFYKFPWSTGGASLSRDCPCGTVFCLLYGDRRWHWTLSSDNSRPICSTSDVSTNRGNIHHRPAVLWRFSWFCHRIQNCPLTYILTTKTTATRGHYVCGTSKQFSEITATAQF